MLNVGDRVTHKGNLFDDVRFVTSLWSKIDDKTEIARLSPEGVVVSDRLNKVQ